MQEYWTHNVAYHPWILKQIEHDDAVLDVGCGDGLLVQKLSPCCRSVIGLEPHAASAETARLRVQDLSNAQIRAIPFDAFGGTPGTLDAVIFAASIHHMDMLPALEKAKSLLAPGGRILIVGCARAKGIGDLLLEAARVIPSKIGSAIHGEHNGGEIGVPTAAPALSYREVCDLIQTCLPGSCIRRGLYYRYLLSWQNPDRKKEVHPYENQVPQKSGRTRSVPVCRRRGLSLVHPTGDHPPAVSHAAL